MIYTDITLAVLCVVKSLLGDLSIYPNNDLTKKQMKTMIAYVDLTTDANGDAASAALSSLYPNIVVMGCILDYDYYKPYAPTYAKYKCYYENRIYISGGSSQANMEFRVIFTLLYHDR